MPVCHRGVATSLTIRLLHNPEKIVGPYVKPGMTVMGMGWFSIIMATMVGNQGRMIAVDLARRIVAAGEEVEVADRIQTHKCEADRLGIEGQADFALAFMMVHEVPDQRRLLGEICGCPIVPTNRPISRGQVLFEGLCPRRP